MVRPYWARAKLAVTAFAASMATMQVPVPEHAPDQPVKVDEAVGVAVSVTVAPAAKAAEQTLPQAMPEGADVTVPVPAPLLSTVKAWGIA
jgi:hypothetical protein